jgi:hypothetical protein
VSQPRNWRGGTALARDYLTFSSQNDGIRLARGRLMGLYQHPHLTRGVVHTPEGAFRINRGIVELPDELGESFGWTPVKSDADRDAALTGVRLTPPSAHRTDQPVDRPR